MNGEETWREGEGFWRGGGDDPRSVSTAYNMPYMAVTPIGRRPRQQNITGTLNDNMTTETEYTPIRINIIKKNNGIWLERFSTLPGGG